MPVAALWLNKTCSVDNQNRRRDITRLQKHLSAFAVVGIMTGAAPIVVIAQTQQAEAPVAEVTSSDVEAFVAAYKEIQAVDQEYVPQMQQASDAAELQALKEEAQIKRIEAVDATSGIDADRFVEIMTIAQNDSDLSAQVVEKLKQ